MTNEKMKVLRVDPFKEPKVLEIDNTLETLQKIVGGYIEVTYPYDDLVGIICNDEGKINNLEPNRALYQGESTEPYDIICGTFLVVGLSDDDFQSLSDDLIEKYKNKFSFPMIPVVSADGKTKYIVNPNTM